MNYKKFLFVAISLFLILGFFQLLVHDKYESEKAARDEIKELAEQEENNINRFKNSMFELYGTINNGNFKFTGVIDAPDDTNALTQLILLEENNSEKVLKSFDSRIQNKRFSIEGAFDDKTLLENPESIKLKVQLSFNDLKRTFDKNIEEYIYIPKENVSKNTEEVQNYISEPSKPIKGLRAETLIDEFVQIGYNFQSMNYDNDLWSVGVKEGSSISIIGREVKSILLQPMHFYNPLEIAYIVDFSTGDIDLTQWVISQISNSNNGRNSIKNSISKNGVLIEFNTYPTNYEIKISAE